MSSTIRTYQLQPSPSAFPRRKTTVIRGHTYKGGTAVGVKRQKTFVRPERQRTQRTPLLRKATAAPPAARAGATTSRVGNGLPSPEALTTYTTPPPPSPSDSSWWTYTSHCLTCCVWPRCLRSFGMNSPDVQQAWREKLSLCIIIGILCSLVAFFTFGLKPALCPDDASTAQSDPFLSEDGSVPYRDEVIVSGFKYDFAAVLNVLNKTGIEMSGDWHGVDITGLFGMRSDACAEFAANKPNCSVPNKLPDSPPLAPATNQSCPDFSLLNDVKPKGRLFFFWDQIKNNTAPPHTLTVFNGRVLNLTTYLTSDSQFLNSTSPLSHRKILSSLGRDATYSFLTAKESRTAMNCLLQRYQVGFVDRQTNGCAAYQIIMIITMVVVLGVVFARFLMAVVFYWVVERGLRFDLGGFKFKHQHDWRMGYDVRGGGGGGYLRESADSAYGMRQLTPYRANYASPLSSSSLPRFSNGFGFSSAPPTDMYTILLVTCYSESARGIRNTLESLAETTYPDDKKLLFVICDGLIKGEDWKTMGKTTPDVVVDMVSGWEAWGGGDSIKAAEPKSYLAIAEGSGMCNVAKVYAGHFVHGGKRVPMVVVVKCGPAEENVPSNPKPGNRGKRDSQLILMNFLSRTLFNDRMTPLDHDLSIKIPFITGGITPDRYEAILMVDADTKVSTSSLRHMVDTLVDDPMVMGLCGETRIENKKGSWVTRIQVFEYFISHHLGKGFESFFGGVTCLPGCFCMYRIKGSSYRHNSWGSVVPLLVNPDVVDEYSENVVDTLHKKNLLLLGEDRFLTTLLLRTFPKRKMVFVPKALCWTTVPETFGVLLSQRRRWINSTVHNLMELVRVEGLCGVWCFGMRFVIALELLGTTLLPISLLSLYILVLQSITSTPQPLPLILLSITLLLPAILISLTTGKWAYIGWMGIYLLALPVWNFVLPLYAFWRFDEFGWGATRKVEGETVQGRTTGKGEYVVGSVVLKRLEEWEEERILGGRDGSMGMMTQRSGVAVRRDKPLPRPPSSSLPVHEPIYGYDARDSYVPGYSSSNNTVQEGYYPPASPQGHGTYPSSSEGRYSVAPTSFLAPSSGIATSHSGYGNYHPSDIQSEGMYSVPSVGWEYDEPNPSGHPYSPTQYASSQYHSPNAPPTEIGPGDKRSWYLDGHRIRRGRKVDSMPVGGLGVELVGWIPEHEQEQEVEQEIDLGEMNWKRSRGRENDFLDEEREIDYESSGSIESSKVKRLDIPVPVVEVVPPTPLPTEKTVFEFGEGATPPVSISPPRIQSPPKQSSPKKGTGPGVRAKSTLPPITTKISLSSDTGMTTRTDTDTNTNTNTNTNKDKEDRELAPTRGLARTVRRFWESVGEVESSPDNLSKPKPKRHRERERGGSNMERERDPGRPPRLPTKNINVNPNANVNTNKSGNMNMNMRGTGSMGRTMGTTKRPLLELDIPMIKAGDLVPRKSEELRRGGNHSRSDEEILDGIRIGDISDSLEWEQREREMEQEHDDRSSTSFSMVSESDVGWERRRVEEFLGPGVRRVF